MNDHCKYVAAKATTSLNFLCHCLFKCSSKVKSAAYKCIVWPAIPQYAWPVWFLHTAKNKNSLDHVQHWAACWASGSRWNPCSYSWTKSSYECITALKSPSIHQHHLYFSICQVCDILHHCSFVNHFQLSNASTRLHPLFYQPVQSSINSYCYSFLLIVHSCGTVFLMPSSGSNSLAHSTLPLVVFFYDCIVVIICCVHVFIVSKCLYILVNCSNFSCCTYELFLCSYIYIVMCIYLYIHVCMCGEQVCRLFFCVTLSFDKIDYNNVSIAFPYISWDKYQQTSILFIVVLFSNGPCRFKYNFHFQM